MTEISWRQVNITYPGADRRQRERAAVDHLTHVLPAAESDGLVAAWFFICKGPWRIRYLLTQDAGSHNEPVREAVDLWLDGEPAPAAWASTLGDDLAVRRLAKRLLADLAPHQVAA